MNREIPNLYSGPAEITGLEGVDSGDQLRGGSAEQLPNTAVNVRPEARNLEQDQSTEPHPQIRRLGRIAIIKGEIVVI